MRGSERCCVAMAPTLHAAGRERGGSGEGFGGFAVWRGDDVMSGEDGGPREGAGGEGFEAHLQTGLAAT